MSSQEFNTYVSIDWNEKIKSVIPNGLPKNKQEVQNLIRELPNAMIKLYNKDTSPEKKYYIQIYNFLRTGVNFTPKVRECIPEFFEKALKIQSFSQAHSKLLHKDFILYNRTDLMTWVNSKIKAFYKEQNQLMKLQNDIKTTEQQQQTVKDQDKAYAQKITELKVDHSQAMRRMTDEIASLKNEIETYKRHNELYINTIRDKDELLKYKDESIKYKDATIKNLS